MKGGGMGKPKKPEKEPRGCVDCYHRGDMEHAFCAVVEKHVARKKRVCEHFIWKRGAK